MSTTRFSLGRRILVRLLGVLALLAVSSMLLVTLDDARGSGEEARSLEQPGSAAAQFGADHPDETVHIVGALVAVVLSASGLAGLVVRPERSGSATHAGAVGLGLLASAFAVGNPDNHGGQAGAIDPAYIVLAVLPLSAAAAAAPWRRWAGAQRRHGLLVLAALAAPAAVFGVDQGLMQRHSWPPLSDPHHQGHWWLMSFLVLATVLVVAGAAIGGRGWQVAATTAALAAAAIATSSLASPSAASALPALPALGTLVWSGAVTAVTWHPARWRRAPEPQP